MLPPANTGPPDLVPLALRTLHHTPHRSPFSHPASPTKFATPLTSLSGNLSSFPFKCLTDYCGPLLQRGVGVAFGPDVAKAWLEGQGLQMVVRSHEVRGRLAGWRALGQAVGLL